MFKKIIGLSILLTAHINLGYTACSFEKLTVLTRPISKQWSDVWLGHPGVERSLREGLKRLNVNCNFDPHTEQEVGDVVIVLADPRALQCAINLKRTGRIKLLLAGPNIVGWPSEHNEIILNPAIDRCIVPSEWYKDFFIDRRSVLRERTLSWFSGVDADFWQPISGATHKDNKNVLVYWKSSRSPEPLMQMVERTLKEQGWNPLRITYIKHRYNYTHEEFKKALSQCRFAVFLSYQESQGLALAESWAMDVPTLVWDPQILFLESNVKTSAAPYLNDSVGAFWRNEQEFKQLLNNIEDVLGSSSPRKWLLDNMTDKVSARRLIEIINTELEDQSKARW